MKNPDKAKIWIECEINDSDPTAKVSYWWRIKSINGKIITPHETSPTKAGNRKSARHWGKALGLEVRMHD